MSTLTEHFVSYEFALELKKKGFPQDVDGKTMYTDDTFKDTVVIPNFHQVHKWMMEYKHVYVLPKYLPKVTPHWICEVCTDEKLLFIKDFFMDYNEALEECITKAINFVKKSS